LAILAYSFERRQGSQARQGPEIDAGNLRVDIRNAGDFALSDGFVQTEEEHQNDGSFPEGAEEFQFIGMQVCGHDLFSPQKFTGGV
jgi:hypothetical protein